MTKAIAILLLCLVLIAAADVAIRVMCERTDEVLIVGEVPEFRDDDRVILKTPGNFGVASPETLPPNLVHVQVEVVHYEGPEFDSPSISGLRYVILRIVGDHRVPGLPDAEYLGFEYGPEWSFGALGHRFEMLFTESGELYDFERQ